ncbi:MAG: 50S ribosomal protein L9 [Bacteroidetes bacterium]|nr:50S ribosomal protein L9 [Bacteroidota bacterium]MDA0888194.1 50S ribosomal protein L9 [Bacteroidota bacterium]MDA1084316.1 50S ribosomal protein L9 [Bacteroidota bacterium]
MELILKQDVENLGFKDDIVTVKNGYGRNFLIPQGLAILATSSARKVLAENLKQRAFKEQKLIEDAQKRAKELAKLELKIEAKAGAGNKLFGSVGTIDIESALSKAGQSVERKAIKLSGGSVKTLGNHTASVRLHREVFVDVAFEVTKAKEKA